MAELPPASLPELGLIYDGWFNFPVRVHPQHTDYSGVAWHGAYVAWMEAARVEYLRSAGISFEELVSAGCNLPVIDLSVHYHQPVAMGENVIVRTKLAQPEKLRLNFDYEIRTARQLCVTASVTLVAVDTQKGKIMRTLPPALEDAIARLRDAQAL